jgi:hypothetical protein
MRYLLPSVLSFALALPAAAVAGSRTATEAERKACEAPIDLEIDSVNARMRGGYSNSEGEYLRAHLRRLKDRLAKCRLVVESAS